MNLFKILTIAFLIIILGITESYSQYDVNNIMTKANKCLNDGKNLEAIRYLNKVVIADNVHPFAYLLRGIAKYNLKDYRGAINDFNKSIEIDPFSAHGYHYRGLAFSQIGNNKQAFNDIDKALTLDSLNANLYLGKGILYANNQNFKKAQEEFSQAIKYDKTNINAYFNRGIMLLALNDTTGALNDINRVIRMNPFYADAYIRRGSIKEETDNLKEALDDFDRALKIDDNNPLTYFYRGNIYLKRKKYQKALSDYDKVLSIDSENSLTLFNRALLKTEIGDYDGAIADYEKILTIDTENITVLFNKGCVEYETESYIAAEESFTQAIDNYPVFVKAYLNRGYARKKLGKEKLAYTDINKAKQISKEIGLADSLGYAASDSLQKHFDKLAKFTGSFSFNPENDFSAIKDRKSKKAFRLNSLLFADSLNNNEEIEAYKVLNPSIKKEKYKNMLLFIPNNNQILQTNNNSEILKYFSEGISNQIEGNYKIAENAYIKCIEIDSSFYPAIFNIAVLKEKMEENNAYLTKFTNTINIQNNKAVYQKEQNDAPKANYESVLEFYNYTVKQNPSSGFAYYNRANLKSKMQNLQGAISDYTFAINLEKDFAEAYYNRGVSYIEEGLSEKGCIDLSKAGQMGIKEAYEIINAFCTEK